VAGGLAAVSPCPLAQRSPRDAWGAGLNAAAGFLQASVSRRLRIRLTPRLVFLPDPGIKEGFELGEKIKGLFS